MTAAERSAAWTPLQLVGAVARLLNAGLRPERTLGSIAELLRAHLPAHSVAFWLREAGESSFRAVRAPVEGGPAPEASSLDALPAAAPGTVRVPLRYEGERFGMLEAVMAPGAQDGEVLEVVAEVLGPLLTSIEISEDLAYEVALQSREIQEQRRFTDRIIDSLPLGLYVIDREYRIQIWNRKRETGTQGLRREDVIGRPVFEVLTRQPHDQLRAEFDQVFRTGELMQAELEVAAGDSTYFYRISKIPMRMGAGDVTHVITIGEDVTAWHALHARITQNEKLAAVGQLAAGVMHEINNPLATIGACVAALDGRLGDAAGLDPVVGEYLQIIEKEVDRCTGIVDGLLDFSRPKGKAKRPTALNPIVDDALFLLRHHERYGRVTLVRELEPALPEVQANREQIVQLLMALLLNALDAMEHGGELGVRTRIGRQPDTVELEVSDTGAGISRADQAKIFEPFFTTKAVGRGTGLGLSICYGIVQEHGGRLEVDSQAGRGSVFRVILPAAGPAAGGGAE